MIDLPLAGYFACGTVGAAGFAILFNVPPRLLLVAALGGGIAVATRGLVTNGFAMTLAGHPLAWGGLGIEAGATLGSLAAGTWGVLWTRRMDTSSAVLSVPAIIPLVPGVFSYKCLMNLMHINHVDPSQRASAISATFEYGLKAVVIVIGISLGVAIPRMVNLYLERTRK